MVMMLVLGVLSVVTVASAVAYQRGSRKALSGGSPRQLAAHTSRRATKQKDVALEDRRLDTLQVGDVLLDGPEDWLVVGCVRYQEEDEYWFLYRVDNGSEQKWLEARQRKDWQAAWLEMVHDLPNFGQLADGFTFRHRVLQLWRRGDARIEVTGEVDGRASETIRYATYVGRGDELLCVESGREQQRALFGRRIVAEGLMLMPGGGSTLGADELSPNGFD